MRYACDQCNKPCGEGGKFFIVSEMHAPIKGFGGVHSSMDFVFCSPVCLADYYKGLVK